MSWSFDSGFGPAVGVPSFSYDSGESVNVDVPQFIQDEAAKQTEKDGNIQTAVVDTALMPFGIASKGARAVAETVGKGFSWLEDVSGGRLQNSTDFDSGFADMESLGGLPDNDTIYGPTTKTGFFFVDPARGRGVLEDFPQAIIDDAVMADGQFDLSKPLLTANASEEIGDSIRVISTGPQTLAENAFGDLAAAVIGGVAGFAVGGPAGAAVGAGVGLMFPSAVKS